MAPELDNYSLHQDLHPFLDDNDNNSGDDFPINMDSDDDDDSITMGDVDDMSELYSDDFDSVASSSSTPSEHPPERTIPVLPKDTDVCFKSCKHPGTVKWRETVKHFSDQEDVFPEWNDTICTMIRNRLDQDYKIRRFLVNLDKENKPSKKISEGMWYQAMDQEILDKTKQRFLEDRKDRTKKANGGGKRPVGRPKKSTSDVSASPDVASRRPHHSSQPSEIHQIPLTPSDITPSDILVLCQHSLSELVAQPAALDHALRSQSDDDLRNMSWDLGRLLHAVNFHLQQRYPYPPAHQEHAGNHHYASPGNNHFASPHYMAAVSPRPESSYVPSHPFDESVSRTAVVVPSNPTNPFADRNRNVGVAHPNAMISESSEFRQPPPKQQQQQQQQPRIQGKEEFGMLARRHSHDDSLLYHQSLTQSMANLNVNAPAPMDDEFPPRGSHMERRFDNTTESVEFEAYEYRVERRRVRGGFSTHVPAESSAQETPRLANVPSQSSGPRMAETPIAPEVRSTDTAEPPLLLEGPVPDVTISSTTAPPQPTSSRMTFDVCLDNEQTKEVVVIAGQLLKGKVLTQVRDSKVVEGKLSVRVVGKEEVSLDGLPLIRRSSVIVDQGFLLRDLSDEALTPGDHEIPFAILLPVTLPASSTIDFHGRAGVRIAYEIRVVYEVGGRVDPRSKQQPFSVKASPLPDNQTPVIWGPKTHELRSMRILKKGSLVLGVRLKGSQIGRGDSLDVSIAIRNHSSVEIKQVQVKLVEKINWFAVDLHDSQPYHTEKTVLHEMEDVNLPRLTKRSSSKSNVIHNAKDDKDVPDKAEMIQELESGANSVRLPMPEHAHDSYSGKMVVVTHYLQVKLITSFSTENFSAKIPLTVGDPPSLQPKTSSGHQQQGKRLEQARHPLREGSMSTLSADSCLLPGLDASNGSPLNQGWQPLLATEGEERNDRTTGTRAHSSDPPAPSARDARASTATRPSLNQFIEHVDASEEGDIYKVISDVVGSVAWKEFIASLTAEDFGCIIENVSLDSDRPRVAEMLASHVRTFTCQHAAHALQKTSFRVTMAKGLVPQCVDADSNLAQVKGVLDDWDVKLLSNELPQMSQI